MLLTVEAAVAAASTRRSKRSLELKEIDPDRGREPDRRACCCCGELDRVERLTEVGDEVVPPLDPDRQADQRRVDRERSSCGHRHVGHRGGDLDQRLDATERFGEREQLRPLGDGDGPIGTAGRAHSRGQE